jgi:hypothetical protein
MVGVRTRDLRKIYTSALPQKTKPAAKAAGFLIFLCERSILFRVVAAL